MAMFSITRSINSWGRKKALERLSGEASEDPAAPTEEAGIVSEDS